MLKSCKYCGRVHPAAMICPQKPARVWGSRNKRVDRFRHTRTWKAVRLTVLERDYHLCRVCHAGEHGRYLSSILEVHHIVPLAEDFDLRADADNLITLCPMHHKMAEDGSIDREELRGLVESPPGWSDPNLGDF